jgi:uncharacterized membrane protein YbhN (UPF0104 family)
MASLSSSISSTTTSIIDTISIRLTHRVGTAGGTRHGIPIWLLAVGIGATAWTARTIRRLATARHTQQLIVAATRKAGFPEAIDHLQFPQVFAFGSIALLAGLHSMLPHSIY